MPTVQIKNVPPEVHQVLRRRAAEAGQSLQEYTLAFLVQHAKTPTLDEVFARIDREGGPGLSIDSIVEAQRADRDSH